MFLFFCFLLFFFCFNGYSFLVCLKSFCYFPLDEIVVFLMFIYLLILYDRFSLCFVVCFSYWLLGFYVFIYLIKYVFEFLFRFIAFLAFSFSLLSFANAFFLFKCSFLVLYVCFFYAHFFLLSCSLFVCVII